MIKSAALNRKHGDRLSSSDLANQVLKIIKARKIEHLNGIVNKLAEEFGYSYPYISNLETEEGKVSDVLARMRLSRDIQIYRLLQLGWTQQEAGEVFGLAQPSIVRIITNITNYISNIQQ